MSDERLSGKSIVVTGAASGIGRATVQRALAAGALVAAVDRDGAGLQDLLASAGAAPGALVTIEADVADAASIEAALAEASQRTSGLDVVFANAGIGMDPTPTTDLPIELWTRIIAVNLSGTYFTLRAAIPHVRRRGGGLLLATGSSTAIRPGAGMVPYIAAKAGVHNLVRSLALELAGEGIRAVVLAPGLSETGMTRDRDGYIENGLKAVPLGRVVVVDEVAALAVHLMSDDSSSVTGSTFVIDAGRTAV